MARKQKEVKTALTGNAYNVHTLQPNQQWQPGEDFESEEDAEEFISHMGAGHYKIIKTYKVEEEESDDE